MTRTHLTLRRAGAFGLVLAVGACVEIASGPSGVSAIRLVNPPPSIIIGDQLRDSTGAPTRLRVVAFGSGSDTITDAPFRYTALPLPNDTTTAAKKLAITVDSITGDTRALGLPFIAQRARIAVTLGERLQVIDTIAIVPRPTNLTRQVASGQTLGPDLDSLFYDCRSSGVALISGTVADTLRVYRRVTQGNVIRLALRVLTGDSAGTTVPVRRFLVQYRLDSANGKPASQIPTVTPTGGRPRPIIGIIARSGSATAPPDTPVNFDTTDATGVTSARLRIFPQALGAWTSAAGDTVHRVVITVLARLRPDSAIIDSTRAVIKLRRLVRNPIDSTSISCNAP